MAVLADAREPERRTLQALAARAGACLGNNATLADSPVPLSPPLFEQLRRLSHASGAEWARLEPEDVATWLCWGVWWRKAGLRNGATLQSLTTTFSQQEEKDQDAWDELAGDDDENAEPALPLHQWPDPQLARAFRTWAASPRTGEPLHWLLRPATAGAHPAWMGRGRTTPVLLAATDVTEALAVSRDDLLWLAPEHAHWRERQDGAMPCPFRTIATACCPSPAVGCACWRRPARAWPARSAAFWTACWLACPCTRPRMALCAATAWAPTHRSTPSRLW